MSAEGHLSPHQFHEMTRPEFEALPGTMFHGNPTGNFNAEQPQAHYGFHVGSQQAAEEAVRARAGSKKYSTGDPIPAPAPSVRGGRIVSPMVNSPNYMGWYGRGDRGDMNDSGDVSANARAAQIHTKGQTMRRGIYYKNASEDAGSTSAVLPSRASFKTHEDYLVDAIGRGDKIPQRALGRYKEFIGQQRLF